MRDDEIFAEALDLPPIERAGYLERVCAGDDAQRSRIEALLRADAESADFLERPAQTWSKPAPRTEEAVGDVIGRYTLLQKIGEGGCGTVYLAEQTEPLRRRVALKVIKLGMDTRAVIARFEAERQALALMDHPDIARVFDAGATKSGRPYFVMEYVDGVPITRFCDEHDLALKDRLELFARVCLALQHAHQKGVIHRDVKPSNILVSLREDGPAPKIIDFGIAKATEGRLGEETMLTGLDQMVGTPAYMSPEQVERRDLDIDTRSDVYALGVLLYELLTGRPPFDPRELVQAGLAEIRRIIRDVDPPRPSTALHTLTHADRTTVAKRRAAAPAQLTSVLKGDLDWIVMRCLEKDRARRYDTAHALADDVRRHLRREPVLARPPELGYRTRRFVSRHRVACASGVAVALALVIGTAVSLVQASRARRAEAVARQERDAAEAATRAESAARADAQRRQEQAEALLTFMLGDFRSELKKIGKLDLLDAVGDKAFAHFAALDPKDLTDTVLTSQAKALTQLGEIRIDQARYVDAAKAFTSAYDRAAALFARHPDNADMLFERAQAEFWIGFTLRRQGNFADARTWLARYRDSTLALKALEGDTPRALQESSSGAHNLAVLDFDQGNLDAARTGFEAVQTFRRRLLEAKPTDTALREQLGGVASWLGRVAEADGRYAQAIAHHTEMIDIYRKLAEAEPKVPRWLVRVAEGRAFVSQLLAITGRRDEAMAALSDATDASAAVVALDTRNQQWPFLLMECQLRRVAYLLVDRVDDKPLTDLLALVRGRLNEMAAADSTSRFVPGRELTLNLLETRLLRYRDVDGAGRSLAKALEIGETLARNGRADALILFDYAQALLLAGRREADAGNRAAAIGHWRRVVELFKAQTASRDWRVLDPLAQAFILLDDAAAARPLCETLRRQGYRAVDPLSASTLGADR